MAQQAQAREEKQLTSPNNPEARALRGAVHLPQLHPCRSRLSRALREANIETSQLPLLRTSHPCQALLPRCMLKHWVENMVYPIHPKFL